jgi:hypothetical protein
VTAATAAGVGVLLYSLNGQTVEANDLGDFFISNVAAPDVFPAGFVGDDFLFLTGMKITEEGTTYYYNQVPFQISVVGYGGGDREPAGLQHLSDVPVEGSSATAGTCGSFGGVRGCGGVAPGLGPSGVEQPGLPAAAGRGGSDSPAAVLGGLRQYRWGRSRGGGTSAVLRLGWLLFLGSGLR